MWVESIYNKLEAVCHEVEELVTQDPVKYVGNQVNTVGESMKKFYSGIVQDILPSPLVVVAKSQRKEKFSNESNSMVTQVSSVMGDDVNQEESPENWNSADTLGNSGMSSSSGLGISKKDFFSSSKDAIGEAKCDISLGKEDDALQFKKSNLSIKSNSMLTQGSSITGDQQNHEKLSEKWNSIDFLGNSWMSSLSGLDISKKDFPASTEEAIGEAECNMSFGKEDDALQRKKSGFCIKSNSMVTQGSSVTGDEKNQEETLEKWNSFDTLSNSLMSSLSRLDISKKDFPASTKNAIGEAECDMSFGKEDDALQCRKLDLCIESNSVVTQGCSVTGDKQNQEESPQMWNLADTLGNSWKSSLSGVDISKQDFSASTEDAIEEAECDMSLGKEDDALQCKTSDLCIEVNSEENFPMKESSEPVDVIHRTGILGNESFNILACDAELKSTEKKETACKGSLDEPDCYSDVTRVLRSPEFASSVVCNENEVIKTVVASISSLSAESCYSLEVPHTTQENICHNPAPASMVFTDSSSRVASFGSFPVVACNKEGDASNILSNSVSACKSNGHANDSTDIASSCLETIDLTDKVNAKLDESCVFVDSRLIYGFSSRSSKLKSYKKLLQNAFASRKRIRKEYEQLVILYGDIDAEYEQLLQQNPSSSLPTTLISKTPSPPNSSDSEWELV